MIAPLLRSMVCPPNFSVLRREGSRRDFDAFGRSRRSCEGTTTAGGALEVVKTAAPAVNGGRRWKSPPTVSGESRCACTFTREQTIKRARWNYLVKSPAVAPSSTSDLICRERESLSSWSCSIRRAYSASDPGDRPAAAPPHPRRTVDDELANDL